MRAALYARFSSEGQRETSIDDQFRNCDAYAVREGWEIVARYADKAISGSTTRRPEYQDMLADAKAKKFDVLLVDDLSRLTRDEGELIHTRKRLVYWGVRVIGVSDGFDTNQKGHKIHATFHGMKNELYLDDLAAKTHRGLTGQALKGHNCGGRAYGYTSVPIESPTERDEFGRPKIEAVERVIDEAQATVVRQVFTWYAEGRSPRWIARELNRQGIPGPGAVYKRRHTMRLTGTWCTSSLHGSLGRSTGMLHNPLYIGRRIWNRREWVHNPETKRRVPRLRPESEWIVTDHPDLRIIPQPLWDAVQARRQSRPKMTKGSHPTNVKYLLSGVLVCGVCGSRYVMADGRKYACAGYVNRGACTNKERISRAVVEARCLEGVRRELLTPEVFARFVEEVTRDLATPPVALETTSRTVADVETDIGHLLNAMKQGIVTPSTKAELERLEAERATLIVKKPKATVTPLLTRAKSRYAALVKTMTPSTQSVALVREQLRVLVGEITLHPQADGSVEAEMGGRYEGVLKLVAGGENTIGCGGRI